MEEIIGFSLTMITTTLPSKSILMFLNCPVLYSNCIASEKFASFMGVSTSNGILSKTKPGSTRFKPWTLMSEIYVSSADIGKDIEAKRSNNKNNFFINS